MCVCGEQGEHLLRGCTWKDYRVLVEDWECEITSVDEKRIGFRPSANHTASPLNSTESPCSLQHEFHLVVSVIANCSTRGGFTAHQILVTRFCDSRPRVFTAVLCQLGILHCLQKKASIVLVLVYVLLSELTTTLLFLFSNKLST